MRICRSRAAVKSGKPISAPSPSSGQDRIEDVGARPVHGCKRHLYDGRSEAFIIDFLPAKLKVRTAVRSSGGAHDVKIICGDESGSRPDSDAMVVCGLMVDARTFFTTADVFNNMITESRKLDNRKEKETFKTSQFIGDKNAAKDREKFEDREEHIKKMCKSIGKYNMDIFCIGISFDKVGSELTEDDRHHENNIVRTIGGMFICTLVQNRIQNPTDETGRTFVVFDNCGANSHVNRMLKSGRSWTDGIRQVLETKNNEKPSRSVEKTVLFNQIIDRTVYAIRAKLSSHVLMADMVSYIYRRHLNLMNFDGTKSKEKWTGERKFIRELIDILEPQRCKLDDISHAVDEEFLDFYEKIKHSGWNDRMGK